MAIEFHKMHGCGNDFIVFSDPAGVYGWDALAQLARKHCPRRFAVGADGLIAVGHSALPGSEWPAAADFEMRYVNADGSRAEMCGNGIRCVGKYIADVLGDARDELRILTGTGVLPVKLMREGGSVTQVTVGMGVPKLRPEDVPTTLGAGGDSAVQAKLDAGGERLTLTAVSMGNPHAVCTVERITDRHVHTLGPLVEKHSAFPAGTNAEFIEVRSPRELRMRVWERGVGETWACGTGACAAAVAAVLEGRARCGDDIAVVLSGGTLTINWPAPDAEVSMTGPAEISFTGTLLDDN